MLTYLVLWCENKGNIPGIHYFYLTRARHDIWMRALGRDPTVEHLSEKNVICSKHFSPNDVYIKGNRMLLKPNVAPSLFLRKTEEVSSQERTLQELHGNTLQNIDPQHIEMDDNLEVLFVKNKENVPGVSLYVSCTPTIEIAVSSPSSVTTSSVDSPRSFKRSHEDTSTDREGSKGQIKRARRDIKTRHNYSASLSKLLLKLEQANVKKSLAQKKVKAMKVKVNRLKKRVTTLKQILWTQFLEKSLTGVPLSLIKRTIEIKKKGLHGKKLREKFNDDLKTFAMTLKFLSSKAYLYVRKVFDLALPAPSTIRKWLSKINCEPGFCEHSFSSLKILVEENNKKKIKIPCAV